MYHHIVPSVILHSIRSLRELLPIALDSGIVHSIEAHVHSYLESPAMVLELLGEVKGLRHTLDYSHFICLGYRQEEVDALASHAVHVHLRKARPGVMQAEMSQGTIPLCQDCCRVRPIMGFPMMAKN